MDYKDFWRMENYSHSDLGAAERYVEMMSAGEMSQMLFVEDEANPGTGEWLGYNGIVWGPISNEYMRLQVDKMVAMVLKSAKNAYFVLEKQITEGVKKVVGAENDEKSNTELEAKRDKLWKKIVEPAEKFARHYNSQSGVKNVLKVLAGWNYCCPWITS